VNIAVASRAFEALNVGVVWLDGRIVAFLAINSLVPTVRLGFIVLPEGVAETGVLLSK